MSKLSNLVGASSKPCALHKDHRPSIIFPGGGFTADEHHIWPRGEGGPDVASNRVRVCPTGHRRVHEVIRILWAHEGRMPTGWARKYHPNEVKYGRQGYEAIKAHHQKEGLAIDPKRALRLDADAPKPEAVLASTLTLQTSNSSVTHADATFSGAAQRMTAAYTVALTEHERRIHTEVLVGNVLRQMQVFWNVVWAFVITQVVLDVGPLVAQAFNDNHWPDWSKIGFAAGKVAIGGVVAYFIKGRKVDNDPHLDPPPPPPAPTPTPLPPAPDPQPEPQDAGDGI